MLSLALRCSMKVLLWPPDDDPGDPADDEEDVPEPDDEVHLVDDDVQAEDAEGVESGLPPPGPVLVVGAARHPGEGLAHRVPGVLQHHLLRRQAVEPVHVGPVGEEVSAWDTRED